MIISKFCESTCLPPQNSPALSSNHLRRIQPEWNDNYDDDKSLRGRTREKKKHNSEFIQSSLTVRKNTSFSPIGISKKKRDKKHLPLYKIWIASAYKL